MIAWVEDTFSAAGYLRVALVTFCAGKKGGGGQTDKIQIKKEQTKTARIETDQKKERRDERNTNTETAKHIKAERKQ